MTLDHITIRTTDPDASRHFFETLFGGTNVGYSDYPAWESAP